MLEKIILLRNTLYRCFLLLTIFYIFSVMFYLLGEHCLTQMFSHFYKINAEDAHVICANYFVAVKLFITCFLLFPAFALHWTGYVLKKQQKS